MVKKGQCCVSAGIWARELGRRISTSGLHMRPQPWSTPGCVLWEILKQRCILKYTSVLTERELMNMLFWISPSVWSFSICLLCGDRLSPVWGRLAHTCPPDSTAKSCYGLGMLLAHMHVLEVRSPCDGVGCVTDWDATRWLDQSSWAWTSGISTGVG